jgi:hypothetical protein
MFTGQIERKIEKDRERERKREEEKEKTEGGREREKQKVQACSKRSSFFQSVSMRDYIIYVEALNSQQFVSRLRLA